MKNREIINKILISITAIMCAFIVMFIIQIYKTTSVKNKLPNNMIQIKNTIKQGYYDKINEGQWANDFEEYMKKITK